MRPLPFVVLAFSFGAGALTPRTARALDYASTTTSLAGMGGGIAGLVMMGSESEQARTTGKSMMIAGFSVSAAASSSLSFLTLLLVATLDHVERLELELASGGGPMIDAYAAGYGIPRAQVLTTIRAALEAVPVRTVADAEAFGEELRGRLARDARLSDDTAGRILYALFEERAHVGTPDAPWHQLMSELTGVPPEAVAVTVAGPIDARLREAAVPGAVISARAALFDGAGATLDQVFERMLDDHQTTMVTHRLGLAERATTLPGFGS